MCWSKLEREQWEQTQREREREEPLKTVSSELPEQRSEAEIEEREPELVRA